jgi:hypothetical protein
VFARTTAPEPVAVVEPVPPEAIGKVPVVRADVEVAYKAPLVVNEVKPVPPLPVGRVPETPVARGRAVPFDRFTADGVPRSGVTKAGLLDRTTDPVPVDVVTPVPPYATAIVEPCHVPELTVPNALTLPVPSKLTDLSAGYVINIDWVPELKLALVVPPALEDSTVVRCKRFPLVAYVPIPTSKFAPPWSAIV